MFNPNSCVCSMASKEIGLLCPSRINKCLLVSEIPLGTDVFYHNLNLGLVTKARICEGANQE
jgi:hypothetical protein